MNETWSWVGVFIGSIAVLLRNRNGRLRLIGSILLALATLLWIGGARQSDDCMVLIGGWAVAVLSAISQTVRDGVVRGLARWVRDRRQFRLNGWRGSSERIRFSADLLVRRR